jgi:hypothetical protein
MRDELLAANDEIRDDDELLTADEACEFIGGKGKPIHPASLYRGIAKGIYHAPVHPSPGISRWIKRRLAKDRARIISGAVSEAA